MRHRAAGVVRAGLVVSAAPAGDQGAAGGEFPRSPRALPPRAVDGLVVAVAACLFAGFLVSRLAVHGPPGHQRLGPLIWTRSTILGAICFPVVFGLWWRRRHPVAVLAIARLAPRLAIRAGVAGAACMMAGRLRSEGSAVLADVTSSLAFSGLATALGMYLGARRAYFDRLRERALFARALASFLPPEVAELVQASPSALSLQQEVQATVLFSDIRGFSTLAESLAPRQAAQVVRRHLAAMAEVVQGHGGMLDKFAGDAVMAVFGVPRPAEDHAQRAVGCAVAMQRRQAMLNAEAAGLRLPATQIGIGVNTGTVIAGTIGGLGRLDYTVLGDAVNVAQRLQAAAPAAEIFVSAATLERAAAERAEPVGSRQLKGRTERVTVYRIPWDPRGPAPGLPEAPSTPCTAQREDRGPRR